MRKKIRQKRKALYSSIYIPKANVILLDENNSAILKQKKKIDKLDNDNKIMAQKKKWNCILYCPGPDIPFGFNALSFLDLTIPPIPIENVFVSSGLNLSFSKGITGTALELGRHKSVIIVIMMKNIKKMDVWEIKKRKYMHNKIYSRKKFKKNKRKFKA